MGSGLPAPRGAKVCWGMGLAARRGETAAGLGGRGEGVMDRPVGKREAVVSVVCWAAKGWQVGRETMMGSLVDWEAGVCFPGCQVGRGWQVGGGARRGSSVEWAMEEDCPGCQEGRG